MAGHSKFKNIMHRKGAQDKKRAKLYTRLSREITVAAKVSTDPDANPRLRSAIKAARDANVPKDRIQNAINASASNKDSSDYQEMRYEGYAPGGIALIVEALTDNRNRTASEVRAAFAKFGGQLAETGSVSFMFEKIGIITYLGNSTQNDAMFNAAIEAGASDYEMTEAVEFEDGVKNVHEITTAPELLSDVKNALEAQFGAPNEAKLSWRANDLIELDNDASQKLIKLLDALDDCDDVQEVTGNYILAG